MKISVFITTPNLEQFEPLSSNENKNTELPSKNDWFFLKKSSHSKKKQFLVSLACSFVMDMWLLVWRWKANQGTVNKSGRFMQGEIFTC